MSVHYLMAQKIGKRCINSAGLITSQIFDPGTRTISDATIIRIKQAFVGFSFGPPFYPNLALMAGRVRETDGLAFCGADA